MSRFFSFATSATIVLRLFLAQVVAQGVDSCITNLEALAQKENDSSLNTSVVRTYVLCPGLTFELAKYNHHNEFSTSLNPITDQPPIFVRPNLHIKCGDDGKVENNCVLEGGHVHVDASTYFTNNDSTDAEVLSNVVFEGVTFSNTNKYMVYGTKPGDITFLNCEFKNNHRAIAPVLLDCSDSCEVSQSNLELSFLGCTFYNNRYKGEGAFPALLTVNGKHNSLSITSSFFVDNDMVHNNTLADKSSFLIESSGSSLKLQDNCFMNNKVGVAPVVTYASPSTITTNYGTTSDGSACPFHALFQSYDSFVKFTPYCVDFDDTFENSWGMCTTFVEPPSMVFPPPPTPAPLYDIDVLLIDRTPFVSGSKVYITHTDIDGYLQQTETGTFQFVLDNKVIWTNGYSGELSTYYTQIQGNGIMLTRRGEPGATEGVKNVWKSETEGEGSSYFFLAWVPADGKLILFEGKPHKPQVSWSVYMELASVDLIGNSTAEPTSSPTLIPELVGEPTHHPSLLVTESSTVAATTTSPTAPPTRLPTRLPTSSPPTSRPSISSPLTNSPTSKTTEFPTVTKTNSPTSFPTPIPTEQELAEPTVDLKNQTNNVDNSSNPVNPADAKSPLGLYIGLGAGTVVVAILAALAVWYRKRNPRSASEPTNEKVLG